MLLSHGLLVLAVDGAKMKLLRNRGNEARPDLELVEEDRLANPPNRELDAERPGRAFESGGTSRHAYAVADRHERREVEFGLAALDRLHAHLLPHTAAVLAAPPHLLGELRKAMKPDLQRHVLAQFDKDLTHLAPDDMTEYLSESRP
jgi:protein required for attachment to host cells